MNALEHLAVKGYEVGLLSSAQLMLICGSSLVVPPELLLMEL